MKRTRSAFALSLALGLAAPAMAETYKLDPAHSGVTFRVSHMMISKVTGRFQKFDGTIDYEKGKPQSWKAEATIDAASIDTQIPDRDKHLRSADFFDVEKYPTITFKSVRAETKGGKTNLIGDLTIHGVTKRVALDLNIGGAIKDPWGNDRFGASATTKISRKDFGLTWNKALETGGMVVGDEVEITLDVEGTAAKKP